MWSNNAQKKDDDSSDEDSSESESDSDSDDAGPSNSAAQDVSREDRKKEKKARKDAAIARAKAASVQVGDLPPSDSESSEEDNDMPANPNHSKAARKQTQAPVVKDDVDEAAEGVSKMTVNKQPQSRRERESMEAAQAKERYMKLHLAGKTEQAQADMERLKAIREKREAEKARKDVSVCPRKSRLEPPS